jgi:hypothetical protein
MRVSDTFKHEAIIKNYGKIVAGGKPFPNISSTFFEVADSQVDQLSDGAFGRE